MDEFVSIKEIGAEVRFDVKTLELGPINFAFSLNSSCVLVFFCWVVE
jgi:hypothetical protein